MNNNKQKKNGQQTPGRANTCAETNRMQDTSWIISDRTRENNFTLRAQQIWESNTDPETCVHYKAIFGIYAGGSALFECT